jgi:arylsulfatase A-like enzyme
MRILLIDIDSLRPDHLGCYGYERDTSPTIDTVAESGVRFENCFVSDAPCLPSRTALATCRYGVNTGVVSHFGEGQWYHTPASGHNPDVDRLMSFQHLAREGIRTVSISSFGQRHSAYHFPAAFQETIQPTTETGVLATETAADVTPKALDWIENNAAEDDWLLHVNYWDVHHPYVGIDDHVDAVRDSGPPAQWPDESALENQAGMTGPRTADTWPNPREREADWYDEKYAEWPIPDRFTSREDVVQAVDGYDAAVRKVDGEVDRLLEALDAAGVREETAIIVTGDHGEALGEHGIYVDHAMPHPPCQRVPLIISWPGVTDDRAGATVAALVYQFDLMPTICDLADAAVPGAWDAEPFTPALTGDEVFEGRDRLVSGHGIYTFGRAVYEEDWVYIRLLHPGVFTFPGRFNDPALPSEGLELLHDRVEDPHCTENLIEDRPTVADRLRGQLDCWLAEQVSVGWRDLQPIDTRGRDPLARMCSEGPFLYVDPDDLLRFYRENRPREQHELLASSLERFPRNDG